MSISGNLERRQGQTLWSQIAESIAEDIGLGGVGPGARLPTEQQLARRFGVNRHTVRRALQALEQRGLVRSEQGRGTFVEDDVVTMALGRRTRFSQGADSDATTRSQQLVRSYQLPARRAAAKALGVKAGTPLTCLEILGSIAGRPVVLGYHHFVADRFPGLAELYDEVRSVTGCLEVFGIADYTRANTVITADLPGAAQARLLKQPANRPVLCTEWLNVDQAGRPVEYGVTLHAGDRTQIDVTL